MSIAADGRRAFVDTNVLVYAHDATEAVKQPIARSTLEELWRNRQGVVSVQVLQEFYVVATRKLASPMSRNEARKLLVAYGEWVVAPSDVALLSAAALLEEALGLSFWDALIVEAARRSGATRLLTEDMQSGSVLAGVMVENPFAGSRSL